MIRGAFWRAAALLLVIRGTGGTSLQSTCSQQSHSDDLIKALCNEKSVQRENQSPCWSLKCADFSGSVGPAHLFLGHMCRKWGFLPPALAYQSPLFISIKGENGNFPTKQKSCVSLYVVF